MATQIFTYGPGIHIWQAGAIIGIITQVEIQAWGGGAGGCGGGGSRDASGQQLSGQGGSGGGYLTAVYTNMAAFPSRLNISVGTGGQPNPNTGVRIENHDPLTEDPGNVSVGGTTTITGSISGLPQTEFTCTGAGPTRTTVGSPSGTGTFGNHWSAVSHTAVTGGGGGSYAVEAAGSPGIAGGGGGGNGGGGGGSESRTDGLAYAGGSSGSGALGGAAPAFGTAQGNSGNASGGGGSGAGSTTANQILIGGDGANGINPGDGGGAGGSSAGEGATLSYGGLGGYGAPGAVIITVTYDPVTALPQPTDMTVLPATSVVNHARPVPVGINPTYKA